MNLKIKHITGLVLCLLSSTSSFSIEGITDYRGSIYVLDSSSLYQYRRDNFELQKRISLHDTAFQRAFANYYKKKVNPGFRSSVIKNRLQSARFLNVNACNDRIFVSVRLVSLDSLNPGWSYLLLEYTPGLEFSNFYFLAKPRNPVFGLAEPYSRFKQFINPNGELLMTLTDPPALRNKNDSEANFAVFQLDPKRNEIRFKRLILSPKRDRVQGIQVNNYAKGHIAYPVNVPLDFNAHFKHVSFPYVLLYEVDKKAFYDPFDHFRYARDSGSIVSDLDVRKTNFEIYNNLQVRQLVLCMTTHKDTVKVLLANYSRKEDFVALRIWNDKHTVHRLSSVATREEFFYFLDQRLLAVKREGAGHVFRVVEY